MNILRFLKPKVTVTWLSEDSSVRQGLEKMRINGFTAVPVISQDGQYKGTVTEGDILRFIVSSGSFDIKECEKTPISSVLRVGFNPPISVYADRDCVMDRIAEQNFLPVTDDRGVFVGIITRRDLIRDFAANDRAVRVEKEKRSKAAV